MCKPQLKESLWYRQIFEQYYGSHDAVIPHLWMPQWAGDIKDPSARVLNVYRDETNDVTSNE